MNILLLSNSAPNYFNFFNALVKLLEKDGEKITIAVDSKFSRKENCLDKLGFNIYEFSDYFTKHKVNQKILNEYSSFNLNSALLSDFERAQIYRIWGENIDINYYDTLKSALLSYFENIFDAHKIDTVLYENVSNSFAHFALFVAQKKGAKYFGIGGSRLPGRFEVTGDPLNDTATAEAFDLIQRNQLTVEKSIREWAADYIYNIENTVPDYMKNNGLDQVSISKKYLSRDRISKVYSLLQHAFDSRTNSFQVGNPLLTHFNLFKRNLNRRFKISRIKRLYQSPVKEEKFLLYPIHFHPECSTSILAGTYLDEYEVIRNIAFNLPEGVRLYVKDHISAWGYPSIEFYSRIKQLPNVRLLGPNEPTKQLIKLSVGVITLTSTVGYEALLLKKRVFLFGHVFYEFHTGVSRIENPDKLHTLLKNKLSIPPDWSDNYNNDFVCAYQKATLQGSINLTLQAKDAELMVNSIYKELKQKLKSHQCAIY